MCYMANKRKISVDCWKFLIDADFLFLLSRVLMESLCVGFIDCSFRRKAERLMLPIDTSVSIRERERKTYFEKRSGILFRMNAKKNGSKSRLHFKY